MKRPLRPLLAALLVAAAPARASQYPLDQAHAIVAPEQVKKLRRAGVRSTGDFLTWGRTPDGRRLLAERAQIPVEQITAWVLLADLMRVPGIGPDVARLLTAASVRTLADLQRTDPEATAAAVREANRRSHLSTNPPGAESIRYWSQLAASLPIVITLD